MAQPYNVVDSLIFDCFTDLKYNANAQLVSGRIDRAYFVDGIDDAGTEVINAAVGWIQNYVVTVGSQHPSATLCLAKSFVGRPVASTTAAVVIVSFEYAYVGNPTTYEVELSTSLESVQTNAEFDTNGNLIPIFVNYHVNWASPDKAHPGGDGQFLPATVNALRPYQTITITKSVTVSTATSVEDIIGEYCGYTNSEVFRGKPAETVMCFGAQIQILPYQGEALVKLIFGYKPIGWLEYARVTNTQFGTPPNIWIERVIATAHVANGIRKVRTNPKTDLNLLVSLLD